MQTILIFLFYLLTIAASSQSIEEEKSTESEDQHPEGRSTGTSNAVLLAGKYRFSVESSVSVDLYVPEDSDENTKQTRDTRSDHKNDETPSQNLQKSFSYSSEGHESRRKGIRRSASDSDVMGFAKDEKRTKFHSMIDLTAHSDMRNKYSHIRRTGSDLALAENPVDPYAVSHESVKDYSSRNLICQMSELPELLSLVNFGNSCYINSILQSLFVCAHFRNFIYIFSNCERLRVISQLDGFFTQVKMSKYLYTPSTCFKLSCGLFGNKPEIKVEPYHPMWIKEQLMALLESLGLSERCLYEQEDISNFLVKLSTKIIDELRTESINVRELPFSFEMVRVETCACGHKSIAGDRQLGYVVNIDPFHPKTLGEQLSDLMIENVPVSNDGFCCLQRRISSQDMLLSLPILLILEINNKNKLLSNNGIPTNDFLVEFTINELSYNLKAFIVRTGFHYFAFVKFQSDWIAVSDSSFFLVLDIKEILRNNSDIRMCFYERSG